MVSKWIISPTYKWLVYWGYNPLILTIDPNFQRDIQVGLITPFIAGFEILRCGGNQGLMHGCLVHRSPLDSIGFLVFNR